MAAPQIELPFSVSMNVIDVVKAGGRLQPLGSVRSRRVPPATSVSRL
jgi:hypothetical protein